MRQPAAWAAVALAAVTIVAYARFLGTGFAATDTLPLIETSRLNGPGDALRLFQEPVMAGTRFVEGEIVYRPFVSLTLGIDHLVWGLNPFGYHLTNLALHLASVIGVFALLTLLGLRWWSSLAGAALFALHPLVVASVPVIARRDSVLPVTAFVWAAVLLLAAQHVRGVPRVAALVGCYALGAVALLSKESAFVALALLPLVLIARSLVTCSSVPRILRDAVPMIPLFAVAIAIFGVRWAVLGGLGGAPDNKALLVFDLDQYGQTLGAFTRDLLWPFAWIAPSTRLIWPRIAGVIVLALAVSVPWLPRRHALLAAAGAAWIVAFGAFAVVFKVATIAWLAYFVLVGVAILFAAALEGASLQVRRTGRAGRRAVALAASGLLLGGLAVFGVASLRESALLRDYYQWDVAGQVTARFTDALTDCIAGTPGISHVRLRSLPGSFDDGQIATSLLGVTLLEDYTIDAALKLAQPDRSTSVEVESWATLRAGAETLTIRCERNGDQAVLTSTS